MEKKLYIILLIILLTVPDQLLSQQKMDAPKIVALKFLTHLYKGEYDEAKKFGDTTTSSTINFYKRFYSPYKVYKKGVNIKIISCNIKGSHAICNFMVNGETDQIELIRFSDGRWLVHMVKEI